MSHSKRNSGSKEDEVQVILGLPGEWLENDAPVDQFVTKAGGRPSWPRDAAPDPETLLCPNCKLPMSLVVQAYAPLDSQQVGEELSSRSLYVYTCARGTCCRGRGHWKVLRVQQRRAPTAKDPAAAGGGPRAATPLGGGAAAEMARAAAAAAADTLGTSAWGDQDVGEGDWGLDSSGWTDSGWADASAPGDSQGLDSLAKEMEAAMRGVSLPGAGGDSAPVAEAASEADASAEPGASVSADDAPSEAAAADAATPQTQGPKAPVLQGFLVYAELEPESGTKDRALEASAAQALADYNDREADSAQTKGAEAAGGAEEEAGTWQGEQYEHFEAGNANRVFMKWHKRIQRSPSQCLRYAFGGRPIWPKKNNPVVQACPHCGAARECELQLMPALCTYLIEGWEYQRKHAGLGAVAGEVDTELWDWCTAALYTCSKSCWGKDRDKSTFVCEEQLLVETED